MRVSTIRRLGRVLYLAWRNVRRSRARLFLLTLLTTVGLLIFLFMYGLSDASGRQLETAIDENLGVEGSYRISIQNELLTTSDHVVDTVVAALDPDAQRALLAYGRATVEPTGCSGTSADGLIIAYEVRSPERLISQASAPRLDAVAADPACIAGIVYEPAALSPLAPLMQRVLELDEQPLVVDAAVVPSIELSVGEPDVLDVIVNYQGSDDRVDALRTGISDALAPMAARSGLTEDWLDEISIQRVDEGESVPRRRARGEARLPGHRMGRARPRGARHPRRSAHDNPEPHLVFRPGAGVGRTTIRPRPAGDRRGRVAGRALAVPHPDPVAAARSVTLVMVTCELRRGDLPGRRTRATDAPRGSATTRRRGSRLPGVPSISGRSAGSPGELDLEIRACAHVMWYATMTGM